MNATFVLDRSHSAKCPFSLSPHPPSPKPFSPESLLRCSGLRFAEAHRAAAGLLCPAPSPLFSPLLRRLSGGDKLLPPRSSKMCRQVVQKTSSTDPLSWSLFHRDWRLGKVAGAHISCFSISRPPSFHEEVCDVCVVVSSCRPLASNTRDLSVNRLP